MPGRIAESVIQQILERVNLPDLIGQQVKLRRRGRNFEGLCPFHSEAKPSFSVSADKGFYYCFGCHESGNAVGYLMKTRGLQYVDAIEQLAGITGVKIEYEDGDAGNWKKTREKKRLLVAVNAEANNYFRAALSSPAGGPGREYAAGRGLDAAVISRFQVGFSPAGDGLYRHLSSKGIPLNLAAEVGLIVQSSRYPSAMDRFQARVTFPVFSLSDEIAGFSARTLPGGADPKYLNSPDSEVFKKGELVFGLVQAREAVKRSGFCILVEGQVDVISMHQAGLENAVAPLGTALTEHQSAVIRRFTDTVYVMFDGDDAGVKATWRAMPILMAAGLYGKVVSLPKPEDPDSLLRKRGREALHEAVAAARPFLEFALWSITTHSGGEMHDRTVAARRGMDFAAQIPSALDRQVFLQRLATELELSPSALRVEAVKPSQPVRVQEAVEEAEPPSRQEQEMVRWVLARPELVRTVCQEGVFDLVASPAVRALMSAILESFEESGQVDVVSVVGGVTDPVLKDLCAQHMLTEKAPDGSTAEAALASLVRMLRTEHVRSHVEKLNLEIRKAQAAGDSARAWELIGERDEADRQALSLTGAPLMKAGRTKEVM